MRRPTADPSAGEAENRPRPRTVRLVVSALLLIVVVCGAGMVFGWMVDETHFDRPSDEFDTLTTQVENLPGVTAVENERWVEAPFFTVPTSWISLTVDEGGLPGVLDAACSTAYPDGVSWSLRVRTDRATEVSLIDDTPAPDRAGGEGRCPNFGFDASRLVAAIDDVVPGLSVQPTIWENGRFALVAVEGSTADFSDLLPLVGHSDDLRDAAGLDPNRPVEINASTLGITIEPGEHERYLAVLTELAENHDVTNFWADDGGSMTDGVARVQILAPDREHAEIEETLRASGLRIAEFPVRFLER